MSWSGEKPINYGHIRDSLELILEQECPEAQERILGQLDEAITNNEQFLVWDINLREHGIHVSRNPRNMSAVVPLSSEFNADSQE